MSLRRFVYYCALCGAWAGLFGWILGKLLSAPLPSDKGVLRDSILGMSLGLVVALVLCFLDAVFNLSLRQTGKVLLRAFSGMLVGLFGGLFGGFVGGGLYYLSIMYVQFLTPIAFIVGWTVVGFLVGASINFTEVLGSLINGKNFAGSFKKFVKCLVGGTVGGILGGLIAYLILAFAGTVFTSLVRDVDLNKLWSPTGIGFVALGACIGLLVGLAQVLLKEAWIKVEAGFRPGREMILTKDKTSIGRAEGSDIALFGDNGVEKIHAMIVQIGGSYFLEDQQTPGGSFVNDQKVDGRTPLKAGDLIRVGKSALRFNERAKKKT